MNHYLNNLIAHWRSLKQMEKHYGDERLKAEQAIQDHLQQHNRWKEIGTMSFDGLKIRQNVRRKWHHTQLTRIKESPDFEASLFPFLVEYKEIKSQSDYLAQREPHIWVQLQSALTIYPAKPYFFTADKGA